MLKLLFAPAAWVFQFTGITGTFYLVLACMLPAPLVLLGSFAFAGYLADGAADTALAVAGVTNACAIYLMFVFARWSASGMVRMTRTVEKIAEGDLISVPRPPRGSLESNTDTGKVWRAVFQMRQNLLDIVGQVRASADHIAHGVHEIAAGYNHLSQRTEEQAATLEETAASIEQFSAIVRQNADHCRQASARAEETGKRAEGAGQSMQAMTETAQRIETSSRQMSEIIGLIEGIAFQTNILALNAAVEAARAGEQGRGFRVVAAEVRALAQKSAQAAEEIKTLIQASTRDVGTGAELALRAREAVEHAVAGMREVIDLVNSVAAASEEQNTGVEEIRRALGQLEQATHQNAALVEEGSAAVASFEQEASRLTAAVKAFRIEESDTAGAAVPLPSTAARTGGEPQPQLRRAAAG